MGLDAMIWVKLDKRMDKETAAQLSYRLGNAVGAQWFFEHPCLTLEKGGKELHTALSARWYGPGYERGTWPIIFSVITWLKANVKGDIYYSNDATDLEDATPLTDEDLVDFVMHWAEVGTIPYFTHYPEPYLKNIPQCCGHTPSQFMYGGEMRAGLNCLGCGSKYFTQDAGLNWEKKNRDDD